MAGLHFPITADNSSFTRALSEVTASVRDASRQIEAEGGNIDKVISKIKSGLAGLGAGWGFKEVASAIANTRGEFQALEAAFRNMLGSGEEAASLMNQLTNTAATTPFGLQEVATGAKQLLAFGVEAEKVNDTIVRLGDIAAGVGSNLGDLVYLYGTTLTQGRMFTQDLRQFQGRGIPLADELAKQFGVAKDKVGDLVTAGKVGSKEFIAAIESMTGSGSKFGGLMDAQSKTIVGQISNIEDAIDSMLNEIGKSSEGLINTTLGVTSSIIENWETVLAVLSDIAIAYGIQKAITVGASAVATASFNAETKALAALLPAKQESVNLDIAEAVSKGRITKATAAKVIAMRKEVQSYLESLAAQKAAAANEAALAAQKYRTALQQSIAAKAAVAAKREELIASGQICGAYISENAVKEMGLVTDKAKQASLQSLAAKQEYNAAMSKKKAAAEALDTATTNHNTVSQNLNARSTNILTVAKEGLVKTTKRLYATMIAHPYALIGAAIAALGYGIYKLATHQTDYEKGMNRINDASKSLEQSISAENQEIDRLFGKLQHAKKGTKEWDETRDAIWAKYGQYLKKLGDEKTALNDVAAAYKLVQQEALNAAKARAMDSFLKSENDSFAGDMGDYVEQAYQLVVKKKGKRYADQNMDAIRNIVEGRTRVDSKFLNSFNEEKTTFAGVPYVQNELSNILTKAGKRRNANAGILDEAERRFGKSTSSGKSTSGIPETRDGTSIDDEIKKLTDQLPQLKKTSKEYADTIDKINKLKIERKAWGDESDVKTHKSTGPTAAQLEAKEENAAGKIADILRKQGQERLRIEQDYEYERWQTRIDLMEEGEAKVIAQQKLDFDKQKTDLGRRLDSELEAELNRQMAVFDAEQNKLAAANKKYAKKTFRDSDIDESAMDAIKARYAALEEDLLAKQKKADNDRLESAKESMNNYLKEFGNYQQKREAIEADYNKRVDEAATTGDRMMLEAQKNKELSDLDYQQWIDTGDIALAFGDISDLSQQTISRLIADMERYRSKVVATFDPEKIEKYEEALSKLHEADVEGSFKAFGNMVPEYFTKRLSIQKQINEQEQIGIELAQKRRDLEKRTQSQKQTVKAFAMLQGQDISDKDLADPKKVQQLTDKITKAGKSGFMFSDGLHEALVELLKLNEEGVNLEKATKTWDGNFSHLKETLANLEGEEKFTAICESVGSAAGLVGDFANQASEMADALGAEGLGEALGYLGDAMGSVQNIASGFAQGGLVGGIAAAAGEVMNWVTKIAMAGDERHQKNIERLQEKIDKLQKSYDDLGKAADNAYSTDAAGIIEQQNALLEQQQALIRQQQAEEEAKKKSDKEKVQDYQEQLEENQELMEENRRKAKEAIIGKDIKGAIDDFASAYASAWEDGTDAAQASTKAVRSIISGALTESLKKDLQPAAQKFYDTLAEAMKDGVLTDEELAKLDALKAEMDAIAEADEEQYKEIQERYKTLDEIREELTDISFDSVKDNFKSLMSDMGSTTEDFTDNFSDMLRNALVNGLMDAKYNKLLEEWYAEFADAMENGELTDEERERLRQKYQAIVDQGIADKNAINDLVGGGAYSQQASSGSAWNMSQETGDELNGRFTAMVELEATNNTLVATGNSLAGAILSTLQSMSAMSVTVTGSGDNDTLLAIRDMMFLSTGHLENIAKYTKHLQTMSEDITKMKEAVERI